mmetsp:Transcript_2653/g.4447  ORF Transcript_2653/g.4447 Transcript_2653/m.4447 type:complete len:262 (-) Transcript_2653:76-861(-)
MSMFGYDPTTLYHLGLSAAALAGLAYTYYYTRNGVPQVGLTNYDLELIAKGFAKGALHTENLGDILKCVQDPASAITNIDQAMRDFESKDRTRILRALKEISAAAKDVAQAMKDCSSATTFKELMVLEAMIEDFKHPYTLMFKVGTNFIINGVEIYQEMSEAYTNYQAKEYEQFGEDLGASLALVFIGSQASNKVLTESQSRVQSAALYELGDMNEDKDEYINQLYNILLISQGREDELDLEEAAPAEPQVYLLNLMAPTL